MPHVNVRYRSQAQATLPLEHNGIKYPCRLHPYKPVPVAAGVPQGHTVVATMQARVYTVSNVFLGNDTVIIEGKTYRIDKEGVQPDTSFVRLLISPERTRVAP